MHEQLKNVCTKEHASQDTEQRPNRRGWKSVLHWSMPEGMGKQRNDNVEWHFNWKCPSLANSGEYVVSGKRMNKEDIPYKTRWINNCEGIESGQDKYVPLVWDNSDGLLEARSHGSENEQMAER